MGFQCGIVGLPNVGKSTLFNALTQTASAAAANYPFCTIEPNSGIVLVPDTRLEIIAKITPSANIIPTQISFVDIAGLVRGASLGEGLGNQFLGHIRQVDAICHVLRCFDGGNITHVEGRVDPLIDAEIVNIELMLSDLESVEKRLPALQKRAKTIEERQRLQVLEQVAIALRAGIPARRADINPDDMNILASLDLITAKPVLYVCNVDEESIATGNSLSQRVSELAAKEGASAMIISAAIEAELSQLNGTERIQFLSDLGLSNDGLTRLINSGYDLLNLITYFTAGPKETRAWTITKGTKAPAAAGVIHTDFEKGFIRCETISYADFTLYKGEAAARDAGRLRLEGKNYIVNDGDILHFRFNV